MFTSQAGSRYIDKQWSERTRNSFLLATWYNALTKSILANYCLLLSLFTYALILLDYSVGIGWPEQYEQQNIV